MFRFYSKNIVLKTFQEHEQWEHHQYLLAGLTEWLHVFELKLELIDEYEQHKEDYEQGKVEYYKI